MKISMGKVTSFLAALIGFAVSASAQAEVLKTGIYHGTFTENCSIFASYDELRSKLTISRVDSIKGYYCMNKATLTMSCKASENEPTVCATSDHLSSVTIYGPQAITVESIHDDWYFEDLNWIAEKTISPKYFRSIFQLGWKFDGPNSSGKCEIPPHNALVPCREIPYEILKGVCNDGIQEDAEQTALNNCEVNKGHSCRLKKSAPLIYQNRAIRTLATGFRRQTESGCEWTAIAE